MNKIKKVFISVGVFITGLISKVFAGEIDFTMIEAKYGVVDINTTTMQKKYGVYDPGPTTGEKISHIGKFAIPVVLFAIGLLVILSKKMTKKVKAIVVPFLALLAMGGYVLMNLLENIKPGTFVGEIFSYFGL